MKSVPLRCEPQAHMKSLEDSHLSFCRKRVECEQDLNTHLRKERLFFLFSRVYARIRSTHNLVKLFFAVALYMGAWIEIHEPIQLYRTVLRSHSMCVRGLKRPTNHDIECISVVALYVNSSIEMSYRSFPWIHPDVALYLSRWMFFTLLTPLEGVTSYQLPNYY